MVASCCWLLVVVVVIVPGCKNISDTTTATPQTPTKQHANPPSTAASDPLDSGISCTERGSLNIFMASRMRLRLPDNNQIDF